MIRRLTMALVASLVAALAASSCASQGDCRYNSDCSGAYCKDGACTKDCVDGTIDCARGYVCNAVAQCEPPGGNVDGGPGGPDASTTDGSVTDGRGGGDSSTTTNKRLLDLCVNDAECSSGLCRPYSKGAQ